MACLTGLHAYINSIGIFRFLKRWLVYGGLHIMLLNRLLQWYELFTETDLA